MSAEYGTTRWWENYAVRYLMPSVAGVVIVKWISSHATHGFLPLLSLPSEGLDTASLTLLFLYGNLFCYVASYPVLVFHVTRVRDFDGDKWTKRPLSDGYITTILLAAFAFIATLAPEWWRYRIAFLIVSMFCVIQLRRLWEVLFTSVHVEGCHGADGKPGVVTYVYGYSYALARRRAKYVETQTMTARVDAEEDEDDERITETRRELWRKDFMDTYRHLREHGNSAFIFLLELGLAALVYCVVTGSANFAQRQLSAVGILFAIWTVPAVFVHLIGQHLERRFSWFDRRLRRPIE